MKTAILSAVLVLATVCATAQAPPRTHKIPTTDTNNVWTGNNDFRGTVTCNGVPCAGGVTDPKCKPDGSGNLQCETVTAGDATSSAKGTIEVTDASGSVTQSIDGDNGASFTSVTATEFHGDGSALTGISGALPTGVAGDGDSGLKVTKQVSAKELRATANYSGQAFVFEGDSLTAGQGVATGSDYPSQVSAMTYFNGTGTAHNVALSGDTIANMLNAEYASQVKPYCQAATAKSPAWVFLLAGINDIGGGASATTIYNNLAAYWAQAKADGCRVVAFTITPTTTLNAGQETIRQTVNTSMKNAPAGSYEFLIDSAALLPDATDSTYYQTDGVHYKAAADTVIATELNAAMPIRANASISSSGSGAATTSTPNYAVVNSGAHTVVSTDGVIYLNASGTSAVLPASGLPLSYSVLIVNSTSSATLTITNGGPANNVPTSLAPGAGMVVAYIGGNWWMISNSVSSSPLFAGLTVGASTAQLARIGGTSDTGFYFSRVSDSDYVLGFNALWNGSAVIAKDTAASLMESNSTGWYFMANSGLTPGGSFSPTHVFTITPTGVQTPGMKATTGTNFVCVDTNGNFVKSTTACSGT